MDIPNYYDVRRFASVQYVDREQEYTKVVGPRCYRYLTGEPLTDVLETYPWLKSLIHSSGRAEEALHALNDNYNATTLAILAFEKIYANTIIVAEWQKSIRKIPWIQESMSTLNAGANFKDVPEFADEEMTTEVTAEPTPASPDEVRELVDPLVCSILFYDRTPECSLLADGIVAFCLAAGLPEASGDASRNITDLRTFMSARPVHLQVASLQADIDRLRELTRSQQRIITNLTYRHLMEHLPQFHPSIRGSSRQLTNTARWQMFVKEAFRQAGGTQNPDHPFNHLLHQFPERARQQLLRVGEELYGGISANIHHFQGEYKVVLDQWDFMQGALLNALSPRITREDGQVDWEREIGRYLL